MRDYKLFLNDILGAIQAIETFVAGMNFEEFEADDKTTSAVIKKFEIIGEAAKMIPDAIRSDFPSVPWSDLAGMRDRLVHSYFGTDVVIVWDAIKYELPKLRKNISAVIITLQ